MPLAFISAGQSNAKRAEPYLESALKDAYGPDTALIRCAVGGSWIKAWQPLGKPFEDALIAAFGYVRQGFTIRGVFFNQGEADTREGPGLVGGEWGYYYASFQDALQYALDIAVPFVHSVLGQKPVDELGADGNPILRPHWNAVLTSQRDFGGPTVGQYDIPRPANNVHYLLETYPAYQVPRYLAQMKKALAVMK